MKTAYTESIYDVAELMLQGNDIVVVERYDLFHDVDEGETGYWCKIFVKTAELSKEIASRTKWEPDGMSPAPHLYATTSFSIGGTLEEIGRQLEQIM